MDNTQKRSVDFADLLRATQNGYDVFAYYLGSENINRNISSPLRDGDRNPSFRVLFGSKKNGWFFKDHAGLQGNAIQFVQYLYKLPNLKDAAKQIDADLCLNLFSNNDFQKRTNKVYTKQSAPATNESLASFQISEKTELNENSKLVEFLSKKLSANFLELQNLEKLGYIQCVESAVITNSKGKTSKRILSNSLFIGAYQYSSNLKNNTQNGCLYRPFDKVIPKQNFGSGVVFGLHKGIEKGAKHLLIVEGVSDYLALKVLVIRYQLPIQVITFGGVNMVNDETIEFIKTDLAPKFENILVCFDTDFEGISAQYKLVDKLTNNGLNVQNLFLNGFVYETEKKVNTNNVRISKPLRNDICDYIQDYGFQKMKRLILDSLPKVKKTFQIKNYLDEVSSQMETVAKNSSQLVIKAPTGTGKTQTFVTQILPKILEKGKKAIFLVPTNSILLQTSAKKFENVVCISSSFDKSEKEMELQMFVQDESKNILVCTYDMFSFLQVFAKQIFQTYIQTIVIDEFHELEHAQDYRGLALSKISEILLNSDFQVIMLSATLPFFAKYAQCENVKFGFNPDIIEIKREAKKPLKLNVLTFQGSEMDKTAQRIYNLVKRGYKVMYYHNNLSDLCEIQNNLSNYDVKAFILSSQTNSNEQNAIFENEKLENICDAVLCTKILESGFNLKDENIYIIYNFSSYEVCESSFMQVLGRARFAKNLEIDLVVSKDFYEKKGNYQSKGIAADYNSLLTYQCKQTNSILQSYLNDLQSNEFEFVFGCKEFSKISTSHFFALNYDEKSAKINYLSLSHHCAREAKNKRTFAQFQTDLLNELNEVYEVTLMNDFLENVLKIETVETVEFKEIDYSLVIKFLELVSSQDNENIKQFFNAKIKRNKLHSSLVIPQFSLMETSETVKLLCLILDFLAKNEFDKIKEVCESPLADSTFKSFIDFLTTNDAKFAKDMFDSQLLDLSKTFQFSVKNELFENGKFFEFCEFLFEKKLSAKQFFVIHSLITKKRVSILDKSYLDLCKEVIRQSKIFVAKDNFKGNLDELYEWFLERTNVLRETKTNKIQLKTVLNTLFFVEKNECYNLLLTDCKRFYKKHANSTYEIYEKSTKLDLSEMERVLGKKVAKNVIKSVLSGLHVKKAYILHSHIDNPKFYETEISDFLNVEFEIGA